MANGTMFHDTISGSAPVLEREREWRTVYLQDKSIEIMRPPFMEGDAQDNSLRWVETPGVTTTTIDLGDAGLCGSKGESAVAAVRVILYERQLYWNNHALHEVELWGRCETATCKF